MSVLDDVSLEEIPPPLRPPPAFIDLGSSDSELEMYEHMHRQEILRRTLMMVMRRYFPRWVRILVEVAREWLLVGVTASLST